MLGSIRLVRVTLTSLSFWVGFVLIAQPRDVDAARIRGANRSRHRRHAARMKPAGKAAPRPAESPASEPGFFGQPGEDPPRPFRSAPPVDRRRSPPDRSRAALYRGPGPRRSAGLVRRGGLAPGGGETRSRLDRHRSPPVPDLCRSVGNSPSWLFITAGGFWPSIRATPTR